MSIFSLQDIHSVMEHEKQLASHYDKVAYIKSCYNDVLNHSLFSYFKDDYLFHAAYYLDQDHTFHDIVDFAIPKHIKNVQVIIKSIHKGIESIKHGEQVVTFTELMCQTRKQVLCLFKGNSPDTPVGNLLLFQDLASGMEEAVLGISAFFSGKRLTIDYLVGCYQEIADSVSTGCYIYFIRPFTHFEHYNGVFSIITRRRLSEDETIELGAMWTKILSDTVIIEVEKKAKIEEQNAIFEEHTHTWNADLTSLYQHLDVINKRFIPKSGTDDTSGIRSHIDYALEKAGVLRKIIHFNLFLMKVQKYPSRDTTQHSPEAEPHDETESGKLSSQNQMLIDAHAPEIISIKYIVKEALQTLKSVTNSHRLVDDHYEKKYRIIEKLEKEAEKFPDLPLLAIPIGVYIIILDLLKNALYHTDFDNPNYAVEISFQVEHTTAFFHVINSGKLPKKVLGYINNDEPFSKSKFRRKGGIRTIKRILECRLFAPHQPWDIHARNLSKDEHTDIYLSIPINNGTK